MIPRLALDTNAYRALVDGDPKLAGLCAKASTIGIPLTVLGELYFGIFYGTRKEKNMLNLHRLLASPRVEVLSSDEDTAKLFGELSAELKISGKPIQQNDVWIAALCKQHGYALATTDTGFQRIIGLEIVTF